MKAIFTEQPGINGKRIRLTTNVDSDHRVRALIVDTPYYLSLPYTIGTFSSSQAPTANVFTIGSIRFKRTSENTVKALDKIPDAWFVDLSLTLTEPEEDHVTQLQLVA
jgi:hypothetical protein